MPYVNREMLRVALNALSGYSPLTLISIPCMLNHQVPVCKTFEDAQEAAVRFGSTEERQWLEKHFKLPGGGGDKPYFVPGSGDWVEARYPDRTLQRRRNDFDANVFFHPDRLTWAFREDAALVLKSKLKNASRPKNAKTPIPLVALMVWMWREREIESLAKGLSEFLHYLELRPGHAGERLIGTVYDPNIGQEYIDAGSLNPEPLSVEEVVEMVGGAPPPPVLGALSDLIEELHKSARKRRLSISPGTFERIVGGWLVGDVVVLVGPTGTGKTTLARTIGQTLRENFGDGRFVEMFFEITPDYDAAQFIGYENLASEFTPGQYARATLFAGQSSDPQLVILDEWNLARIDSYFASVLSALETGDAIRIPGKVPERVFEDEEVAGSEAWRSEVKDGRWKLPRDTLFLATCNSWMEEPDTRLPISGPVKRRCRIITISNVLVERFKQEGNDGIVHFCDDAIMSELSAVEERIESGQGSIFDAYRREKLLSNPAFGMMSSEVSGHILSIVRILLGKDQTRNVVTPGVLRDLLFGCIYADGEGGLLALGQQVADKLLHQIQGDTEVLTVLNNACRDLPNAAEITSLIKQMGGLGADTRITPLV